MCYICISVYELLITLYVITLCVGRWLRGWKLGCMRLRSPLESPVCRWLCFSWMHSLKAAAAGWLHGMLLVLRRTLGRDAGDQRGAGCLLPITARLHEIAPVPLYFLRLTHSQPFDVP